DYLPRGRVTIEQDAYSWWSDPTSGKARREADEVAFVDVAKDDHGVAKDKGPFFAYFKKEKVISYALAVNPLTQPDPEQRYVLTYQHNAFFDDRLCIGRDPNGLLRAVEYAGEDRTPEVLFNVTRAFAAFSRPVGFTRTPEPGEYRSRMQRSVKWLVDPWRLERDASNRLYHPDIASFQDEMARRFNEGNGPADEQEEIHIDFSEMGRLLVQPIEDRAALECGTDYSCRRGLWKRLAQSRCSADDVCYRTKLKVPVDLRDGRGRIIDRQQVNIVHNFDIGAVSVTRAFLVQKITKLVFNEGVLTGVAVRKPSEAEAVSLLPVNAITAVLSSPVGLLSTLFNGDLTTQLQIANSLGQAQANAKAYGAQQAPTVAGITQTDSDSLFQITCTNDKTKPGSLLTSN
ncbi:MAG: hypothetical protein WAW96_04875, partial [Alphaproteobacteria bacterium]